ncbi:MAG TPA: cytochrome c [Blastocatellia bacterium]|nr:cytochrome c [Blastocatellia bacterium]
MSRKDAEKMAQSLSMVSSSYRYKRLVLTAFALAVGLLPFALASAHEPITTKVRFNKEVIRVLQRSCLGCHRPGGIAMSLATYEEARPWAKAIKEEMLEKRMPPWRAVKGYGEFRNSPPLTQRDVDLVVNWVEGGAPKGDVKDLPPAPLLSNDWALGNPDLVVKPKAESRIAADADDYRIFVLTTLKEDNKLVAIDLQPGNGSVVHCAKFFLVKGAGESTGEPMVPVKIDETVVSNDLRSATVLGTWVPGQRIASLDEGLAYLLPAGSRIVVKMHYRGAGEAAGDLSTFGLYFAKTAPRALIQEIQITNPDALIPVAAEPQPLKLSFTTQTDTEAVGIRPRVDPLLISLQATAYRPDGSEEVLIWRRGYQFDWEPTYYFRALVPLPKGTRIDVIAYFDNSEANQKNPNDPPKPVKWSEISTDPLCALLLTSGIPSVNSQNLR